MKYLVKMTDREYHNFRMYTCEQKGFDPNSGRAFASDFRGQEAEDWLLRTGKIELRTRVDSRGRKHNDAYLVIRGSEEWCNGVVDILFTREVYSDSMPRLRRTRHGIKRTVLTNRNLENRIIREV